MTAAASSAPHASGGTTPAGVRTAPSAQGPATPTPTSTPEKPKPGERLKEALNAVTTKTGGKLSLAITDLTDDVSAVYGNEGTFDTASIVKVDVLAALLLKAQDEGRELTAQEEAYAHVMIRNSDNAVTTALWGVIGGAEGLDAANRRFGLTDTTAGGNYRWGLTQTTAEDQLRLLEVVFGPREPPLDDSSRAYIRQLTERIVVGQNWGVTAAAEPGTRSALKNGWLPRSTTGLWDINSIGRIEADGHTYLIAVLSSDHATQTAGITAVEKAVRTAVDVLRDDATPAPPNIRRPFFLLPPGTSCERNHPGQLAGVLGGLCYSG